MDLNLKGKVAIVTGGGTGLGAAICETLAEEGTNVVVNYILGEEEVNGFVESLNKRFGVKCTAIFGDISKAEDIDNIIDKTITIYGKAGYIGEQCRYIPKYYDIGYV